MVVHKMAAESTYFSAASEFGQIGENYGCSRSQCVRARLQNMCGVWHIQFTTNRINRSRRATRELIGQVP